jgi:hypothetical protein
MARDWHRESREPNRAYALFERYLALGPTRSLPTLARSKVASLSHLKKLSASWHWRERAAAWQQQLSRSSDLSDPDIIAEARERHLRDAIVWQQLARAQIRQWLRKDPEGTLRLIRRLSPHQVMRLWQTGLRVEQGLLPAPEPEKVEDYQKAVFNQRDRDERETSSNEAPPPLPKALTMLLRLAWELGVSRASVLHLKGKFLRWLWMSEDSLDDNRLLLSLRPRKKANKRMGAERERIRGRQDPKYAAMGTAGPGAA